MTQPHPFNRTPLKSNRNAMRNATSRGGKPCARCFMPMESRGKTTFACINPVCSRYDVEVRP